MIYKILREKTQEPEKFGERKFWKHHNRDSCPEQMITNCIKNSKTDMYKLQLVSTIKFNHLIPEEPHKVEFDLLGGI